MRVTSPALLTSTLAAYIGNLSPAHVTRRLNFYDDFNRTAEDTDVWTSGGDDGSFSRSVAISEPTFWAITTGNVIDNDRYIHGGDVTKNRAFTPYEYGYTTVTFKARVRLGSIADVSAFLGLIETPITDYDEPAARCAHFLVDPAISVTFRARTYMAAEEETDTLVALDTDYHRLKIVWTAASVLFYIDDVLVATHAAQVPTLAEVIEFLVRTEAAAPKYLRMDSVNVEVS